MTTLREGNCTLSCSTTSEPKTKLQGLQSVIVQVMV